jgi:hypothetical protein
MQQTLSINFTDFYAFTSKCDLHPVTDLCSKTPLRLKALGARSVHSGEKRNVNEMLHSVCDELSFSSRLHVISCFIRFQHFIRDHSAVNAVIKNGGCRREEFDAPLTRQPYRVIDVTSLPYIASYSSGGRAQSVLQLLVIVSENHFQSSCFEKVKGGL